MDYHLIIIGGGAAGKDAALFAARAGIKTLLVEKDQLRRDQLSARMLRDAGPASLRLGRQISRKKRKIRHRNRIFRYRLGPVVPCTPSSYQPTDQLAQPRPHRGRNHSRLRHRQVYRLHQIRISDASGKPKTLTAENFIIATGSSPFIRGLCQSHSGKVTSLRWIIIPSIVISCSITKESPPTS